MARKKKSTKKSPRTSHAVFHGKEPSWAEVDITKENYQSQLSTGLNYYSTIKPADKRKWFTKWAKSEGYQTKDISSIPTDYLGTISGQARMIERGFKFNSEDMDKLKSKVDQLIIDYPPVEKEVDPEVEMMKAFAKEQVIDNLIGSIYDKYDNLIDAQLKEQRLLKAPEIDCSKLNVGQKQEIVDYYTKQLNELKIVYNKADPELVESYKGTPRIQISRLMKLHADILDKLKQQQLIAKAKKPRKARTKKVKSAEQLTAKLKYLTSHKEYGILSIDVSKLVGCTEAWVFNTKNRKLQYYYSDSGITVKGTTLQNFEKGTSLQKTIRKPKEFLDGFMNEPKVRSRKMFEDVNAKASALTGRINEHCVILKVY